MQSSDSVVTVTFRGDTIREDAAQVEKFVDNFSRLSVAVDADVRCYLSGVQLGVNLRIFFTLTRISKNL